MMRAQINPWIEMDLGQAVQIDKVVIQWADGSRQELPDVAVDRRHEVEQPTK